MMNDRNVIFCGNNADFLREELTKESNDANGGVAFRIPSIVNANGTLVAVSDRQSCGMNWGYIELVVRRSEDGGKTWSNIEAIATPPARETKKSAESFASAFFVNPCMTVAKNGDIVLITNFYPESKGIHNEKLLDKKKVPYTSVNGEFFPVIYDREGNFYSIRKDGSVFDKNNTKTNFRVEGIGSLYRDDEYFGNIYLNGAMGKNELNAETTFGAKLKAPKRSYVFMIKSSDNGKTWSNPVDITPMILDEKDGTFLGVSAGTGVTTENGRIIMPLYTKKNGLSIYSDDNGETWHRTRNQKYNEVSGKWVPAVSADGSIFAFGMQKKYGKTPISVSRNESNNWNKLSATELYSPDCQKSIITFGDYVLCSHPSEKKRENGIISVGKFRMKGKQAIGIDWVGHKKINDGFFAYSSLVKIDDDNIGVLFESEPSSYIEFKTFKKSDLI